MRTEEMIVTATTEDGDCDGAPDQQQQGGGRCACRGIIR
jgi:hypothetical protein